MHRLSLSAGQEAFFEGHAHAFGLLGGVPTGQVRHDNLKSAVANVIGFAGQRVETDRWTAFRSHFGIEAFYCQPGIKGAHEKGGAEGQIGWFRRNHQVPVPEVDSIAELNAMIEKWDEADDLRRIGARARTVGEYFASEQPPLLLPLPADAFETGCCLSPRVDRYAQISVRTNRYSVPARLVGRQVRVLLHASELVVFDGHNEVARHERLTTKNGTRVELDHYLEALVRNPGAPPGATAPPPCPRLRKVHPGPRRLVGRRAHGGAEGTRALIEVLMLHRHMDHAHVVEGLAAAQRVGALTADAVALEARKAAEEATPAPAPNQSVNLSSDDLEASPVSAVSAVSSLTERRIRAAQLPPDTRPMPDMSKWDKLLPSRRRQSSP